MQISNHFVSYFPLSGSAAIFSKLWPSGRTRNHNKSVLAHMEFVARKEPPGEGEDLLDVDCITFWHQMALPMSYIYILWGRMKIVHMNRPGN